MVFILILCYLLCISAMKCSIQHLHVLSVADETGKDMAGPETDETHLPDNTTSSTIRGDQTTLLPNEAEAFALEPIDVTSLGMCSHMLGPLFSEDYDSKIVINTVFV